LKNWLAVNNSVTLILWRAGDIQRTAYACERIGTVRDGAASRCHLLLRAPPLLAILRHGWWWRQSAVQLLSLEHLCGAATTNALSPPLRSLPCLRRAVNVCGGRRMARASDLLRTGEHFGGRLGDALWWLTVLLAISAVCIRAAFTGSAAAAALSCILRDGRRWRRWQPALRA